MSAVVHLNLARTAANRITFSQCHLRGMHPGSANSLDSSAQLTGIPTPYSGPNRIVPSITVLQSPRRYWELDQQEGVCVLAWASWVGKIIDQVFLNFSTDNPVKSPAILVRVAVSLSSLSSACFLALAGNKESDLRRIPSTGWENHVMGFFGEHGQRFASLYLSSIVLRKYGVFNCGAKVAPRTLYHIDRITP